MNTPPATADGVVPGASATEGAAPAWLPDEQTLSRMAEQMFRALPGQEPGAVSPPTEAVTPVAGAGAGLPGADLPPPAPRSRPSSFGSAPPTSVPATYGATGAGWACRWSRRFRRW